MAGYTYYFFFSLTLLLATIAIAANMVCFRLKGKTIFGQELKVGTIEHEKFSKLSNNGSLAITIAILLAFVANLVYSVSKFISLHRQGSLNFLIFSTIIVIALFTFIFFKVGSIVAGVNKSD